MLFNAASGRFQQQWAEKKWPAFQKTNHVMKLLEVRLLGVDASWSQVPGAISTRRWNRKTTRHEYSHSHLRSVGGRRSAHRDRRQHEKNIKTSLELNSGPFHNIMLNMNRIKYIFIHQENDIYLFREFWQPCFFFCFINFYYHWWGSTFQPRCWKRQICTSLTADILLYEAAGSVSSPELLPAPVLASAPNWLSH